MSNSIIPFRFDDTTVRTIEDNGNVLFCGKDVATALGYADTKNALKLHCRGVAKYHPIPDSLGRTQETRFITEGDLYRLITSSKLPNAEQFEHWVFDEVLPAIRRQGGYISPAATEHQLNAIVRRAQMHMELLQAARGLIDPKHLEAKARVELARGLGELPQLDPGTRPLYTQDFLKSKNLSKKQMRSVAGTFGKRIKAAYILEHGKEPGKYPLNLPNGQNRDVCAYTDADRALMERIWDTYYTKTEGGDVA